jgi:hypothetical protein
MKSIFLAENEEENFKKMGVAITGYPFGSNE